MLLSLPLAGMHMLLNGPLYIAELQMFLNGPLA